MSRVSLVLLLAAAALASGCTTYKLWSVADSDQEAATVALFYEYRKYESPQVDERAGVELARERCKDWGYPGAQRKGEDRQCLEGEESSCGRWRVIREYRCTGDLKK
jgi:hypothetical protein